MALDFVTLKINGSGLQIIYQGLDELPGKIGRPVFQELVRQVQEQLDAHAAAEKTATDKAAVEARERHRQELKDELAVAAPENASPAAA